MLSCPAKSMQNYALHAASTLHSAAPKARSLPYLPCILQYYADAEPPRNMVQLVDYSSFHPAEIHRLLLSALLAVHLLPHTAQ